MKKEGWITTLGMHSISFCERYLPVMALGVLLYFLMTNDALAAGTNYLEGLKTDVKATFGADSDLGYLLLIAEGLYGAYKFITTKSIPVLLGFPVLMLFTHFVLR